jgi:hypothetical protein
MGALLTPNEMSGRLCIHLGASAVGGAATLRGSGKVCVRAGDELMMSMWLRKRT